MTEYIDREKALKIFAEYNEEVLPFIDEDSDSLSRLLASRELREKIRNLPSEDVTSVKHGKWIHYIDDRGDTLTDSVYCSKCKCNDGAHETDRYCSNCAAEMDLE